VGGVHGAYICYEPDFGIFTTSTASDAKVVETKFQLWNTNSFNQATGTTLGFPGIYYGTYSGDTDAGSNKMKKWFWNTWMTPTIKSTTNEPLLEMDDSWGSATGFANSPYSLATIASWGVEMIKQDDNWTDDYTTDSPFGWDWTPDATSATGWPSGFNLGSMAHTAGLKLSLYMGNTFNHCDLSGSTGVSSEEGALEGRYNCTATHFVGTAPGFDFWRTDGYCEATADYLSHLGFMKVLDYMITNHSGFRWENCSFGGSKKSFDLMARQSVMTTEDSGFAGGSVENFRMAYYANSYMINPVQMKADNINTWTMSTDNSGKYQMRSGFLGAWMWFLSDPTLFQAQASPYKLYQRPIIKGADVYHILPMPDGTNWDGIEFFNAASDYGSVVLFKPNSGVGNSPSIYLKGLVPTNTYWLDFLDRSSLSSSYQNVLGSTLMATPISISGTTGDYDSEVIYISHH
jgi:hypothetical protein